MIAEQRAEYARRVNIHSKQASDGGGDRGSKQACMEGRSTGRWAWCRVCMDGKQILGCAEYECCS